MDMMLVGVSRGRRGVTIKRSTLPHDIWFDARGIRFMLEHIIGVNEFATELKAKYYWFLYIKRIG